MTKKRKVLLTGGSRGIGRAIYDELIKDDLYEVIAPGRDEMRLDDLVSVEKFMNSHKYIDIIINNAGINIIRNIEDISDDDSMKINTVNLMAPLKIIQKATPHMKRQTFGRIVNISSIWGVRSKEFRTLYSGTKFGIIGQTKAISRELGSYNILVNAISPGFVATDLTNQTVPKEEQEKIKETIPLRRFAEPVEIAKLVKFLISEDNTYITGQSIVIDGGFTA